MPNDVEIFVRFLISGFPFGKFSYSCIFLCKGITPVYCLNGSHFLFM